LLQDGLKDMIAELVEIPLRVSFDDFFEEFNSNFLPTLLKQEGIISVATGSCICN
jgi:hypothetical protein